MSRTDDMLREILSDPELMEKYNIRQNELENLRCGPPFSKKVIEVMATMINEMHNNRTSRQIYPQIKNIHKI
jgi:hypothetical protein